MTGSVEEKSAGPQEKGNGCHGQGDGGNRDIMSLSGRGRGRVVNGDIVVEIGYQWNGGCHDGWNREAAEGYVHTVSVLGRRLKRGGKGGRDHPIVSMQRTAHGNADRDQSRGCHKVGGFPLGAHESQVCGIGEESDEAA